jgi:hypothetical protein
MASRGGRESGKRSSHPAQWLWKVEKEFKQAMGEIHEIEERKDEGGKVSAA